MKRAQQCRAERGGPPAGPVSEAIVSSSKLSIVVAFHNMRREAVRTLYTLSAGYQRGMTTEDYEVIAVDNGSNEPLKGCTVVAAHGPNFRHMLFETTLPSPCAAINRAVAAANGENVMICIDGARMLTPGVLRYALAALGQYANPFVYTLAMHLGYKPQNELIDEGYDQRVEDALLDSVDWREDGYRLFLVSGTAYSSGRGFFSRLFESNCFALRRADYLALGGLDERFQSAGGGLVNLDFFNVAHEQPFIQPVMLLGEASFHQFHGGVATNVPRREHPWQNMAAEYARIRGKPFTSSWRQPHYYGWLSSKYHAKLVSLVEGSAPG